LLKQNPRLPRILSSKVNSDTSLGHSTKTWNTVSGLEQKFQNDRTAILNLETKQFVANTVQ